MPRNTPRIPRLCRHKGTGQGLVYVNGRELYLGPYDSPSTREAYERFVAEWLAAGRSRPKAGADLTVDELVAQFWPWAESYYRDPDGKPTGEIWPLRVALRPLLRLYGSTRAAEFGPLALIAVRDDMVRAGLARRSVNSHVGRIRRVFRWAAERELVPGEPWHALQAVTGLRAGRSEARETAPVKPVDLADVDKIRPHVSRQVWALVQLQLLTAARAGEMVILRPCDVDRSGRIWVYKPVHHKTEHRGHAREIYLGPRAQEVLRPFLFRAPKSFCFSPTEAERERREAAHARRVTPESCGNVPGSNRKRRPRVRPGLRYSVDVYGRAIRRACTAAGIPAWHSHQLRHAAATLLRKEFGIETARVVLGHRSAGITEVYAEIDQQKALDAMLKIG